MSMRRRGPSWDVSTQFKGHPRIRRSFSDVDEAIAYDNRMQERIARGLGPEEEPQVIHPEIPTTLKELFDLTRERYWKGSKSEASVVCAVSIILGVMGEDVRLASISEMWVETLIKRLRMRSGIRGQSLSGSTINRKLAVVSRACRYAHRMGWIERVPMFERSKENRHRIRYLSESEEAELMVDFKFLGQEDMRDLFVFLIGTGMRLSEALNCKPEQCDLERDSIHLWEGTTKNDLGRTIPMTSSVRAVVQKRISKPTLFPRLSRHSATHRFAKVKRLTSMSADTLVVLHTLRHTFASRLIRAGVDIPTISQLLGHRSTQMTMRYAHLAPGNLRKDISSLEDSNVVMNRSCALSAGSVGTVSSALEFGDLNQPN